MKVRVIIKGIINYIFAIIFAIVFALFLDANVGWFILLALILAPLMSIFLAWLSSHSLSVTRSMADALMSKGDVCHMTIEVRNKSIFPTPPVEVILTKTPGAKSDTDRIIVSAMSRATKGFMVNFKAVICGKSQVGVEDIRVTDYLGLFTFRVKHIDYAELKSSVSVIPDVAQIGARDDAIVKVMQTSLHMDDSDDTVAAGQYAFGGFPGYDNREYVPGDPLKRINWKQSAKRDKLLVRLDDEMAAHSVNVVLDSVFNTDSINVYEVAPLTQYRNVEPNDIIPVIAQDAIENALGITRVLIRHNYTVNFYARLHGHFGKYEIQDEVDIESMRVELAAYEYSADLNTDRLPKNDDTFRDKVGVFSTPNDYHDAQAVLDSEGDSFYTTVFSVVEEARKQGSEGSIGLEKTKDEPEEKPDIIRRIVKVLGADIIPYFLALFLSIVVFSAFDVKVVSVWTVAQAVMCAGIVVLCEYVKRHKIIGGCILVAIIVVFLNMSATITFGSGYTSYIRWFISAGDYVETTPAYLMTLLMIFTTFFGLVVYYFTNILYRTSYLLLVSMIPLVIYVKVMKPINMTQVVFITLFNIVAFLIHSRTMRDKGKKIVGYVSGLVSLGLYATLFLMICLWLPKMETKYYYMFEDAFLGGNATEPIPGELSQLAQYSGNADGFNEMNNRKLFIVTGLDISETLYLKRQTFDLYDFSNHRWYADYMYSTPMREINAWKQDNGSRSLVLLMKAIKEAEKRSPGILEKYGIKSVPDVDKAVTKSLSIEATNYANASYITPPGTIDVYFKSWDGFIDAYVTYEDVFMPKKGLVDAKADYSVRYYDEAMVRQQWINCGGADMDVQTSIDMLYDLKWTLDYDTDNEYVTVLDQFIDEAREAVLYKDVYEHNNALVSERVKELAQEITKDCVYDWEKAEALQMYFENSGFIYDLSYDAPDDSVEYFLFEGKTGTCSDYASAYVLMARSVGLIVRYVEGFVPDMELSGELVVRSDCGHAYPEVYIPNVGFVIYEATKPAVYDMSPEGNSGVAGYFVYVALRVLVVFGAVSFAIIVVLFVYKIVAPFVREIYFRGKLKKVSPKMAVVMLYKRVQEKSAKYVIVGAESYTPFEYALEYESLTGYDISELTYMVEMSAYSSDMAYNPDVSKAIAIYKKIKGIIKEYKKTKNRAKKQHN